MTIIPVYTIGQTEFFLREKETIEDLGNLKWFDNRLPQR